MKTCPYCDSIISVIGVKNCPNCGATLGSVVEPENTSHIQQKPKPEVKPQQPQQNHVAEAKPRSKAPKVFMILTFIFGTISLISAVIMLISSIGLKNYESSQYEKVDGKITHVENFFSSDFFTSFSTSSSSSSSLYTYEITYSYDNTEYKITQNDKKKHSEGDTVSVYVSKTNPSNADIDAPNDMAAAYAFSIVLLFIAIFFFGASAILYLIAILLLVKVVSSRKIA